MGAKVDILTFESGLVDGLSEVRATTESFGQGARRLENMIALPQGPAFSRPPSRWIAATKSSGRARLFRVVYSDTYAYLVEFGNLYCRFFTDDGQVLSGEAAYEIVSPYATADLDDLQVYNDAGTLYIADGGHVPYRLVYSSATSWTLEAIPFTWGPFRDLNESDITITPSATTGTVTLTAAGGAPFLTGAGGHVGAKFLIGHRVGEADLIHTFTGNGTSATIAVAKGAGWSSGLTASTGRTALDLKSWKIVTSGAWSATLHLEKTYDSGASYETVATWSPGEDANFQDVGDETFDDALYRLRVENWSSGSLKVTFTVNAHVAYGYATITNVASTTVATATVVEPLAAATATKIWAFGAWCPAFGYPRGIGQFDNRLGLVGSTEDPTTWWLTRPNRYTEMRTDETASSALIWTFTVGRGDPFLWLAGERRECYIGTPAAILQIAAADPTSSISPTNKPVIVRRIEFGASAVPPVRALSSLVLLDAAGRRPMKVTYDWEQDLLVAPNLAFVCPTVTAPGIRRIVFQRGPVPILWMLRTDGVLLARTFEQLFREEIGGFSQCYTAGTDAVIEDIEVMPTSDGDVLWWQVARTIDGSTVRAIERLDLLDLEPERATAHALDSYLPFEGVDWTEIESLAVNEANGVITVTITGHDFEDGDNIDFADVVGMTWLNSRTLTVADATDDTFTLKTLSGSYVDGRLIGTYTSGGSVRQVENTFAGLDHLEGEAVYAVADGQVLGPYTVADGSIALPGYFQNVYVGLYVAGWLQPLRLAFPMMDGSSRGRQMSVSQVWLSVYRSWECRVGPDADRLRRVTFYDAADTPGTAPELVTGDFLVSLDGRLSGDPTILIERHLPLPLCVRGLMVDAQVGGLRGGRQ